MAAEQAKYDDKSPELEERRRLMEERAVLVPRDEIGEIIMRLRELSGERWLYYTRHRGSSWEVFGPIIDIELPRKTGVHGGERFLLDSRGDIWVTIDDDVYRAHEDGRPALVKAFRTEEYFGEMPLSVDLSELGTTVFEDKLGRVWACWLSSGYGRWPAASAGLWRLDGPQVEHVSAIKGLPNQHFSAVEWKEGLRYSVAIPKDGLYELDLETFEARRIPEPEPWAFCWVYQLKQFEGSMYVLTYQGRAEKSPMLSKHVLWCLTERSCAPVIEWIDRDTPPTRVVLARTAEGLWVGTAKGLWLVPSSGEERLKIDWRKGFQFGAIFDLAVLDETHLYLGHHHEGSAPESLVVNPTELLAQSRVPDSIEILPVMTEMRCDKAARIYTVLSETPDRLSRWNGERWENFPIPSDCSGYSTAEIEMDSLGRLWYWTDIYGDTEVVWKCPTALFDTVNDGWTTYPNFLKAIEAQSAHRPYFAFPPRWGGPGCYSPYPLFAEDGSILSGTPRGGLFYFNGHEWRVVSSKDFAGGMPVSDRWWVGPSGRFRVNVVRRRLFTRSFRREHMVEETWECEGEHWRKLPKHEPAPKLPDPPLREEPSFSQAFAQQRPDRGVRVQDAQGVVWRWYVEEGQLYRHGLGLTVPVFEPGECHPFTDSGIFHDRVFYDSQGNVFVKFDMYRYIMLRPRAPMPETQVEIRSEGLNRASVILSAQPDGPTRFIYRFDEGPWQHAEKASHLEFEDLMPGEYPFEAIAVDKWLQYDPTPATAVIGVPFASEKQVEEWISALRSENYDERDAAARELIRNWKPALPALKRLREQADKDLLWWIDAIIDQIELRAGKQSP